MRGVAYDLRVRAAWPLPELGRSGGTGDVAVKLARRPVSPQDGDIRLAWPDIGAFVVRGGKQIVAALAPRVPPAALRLFLLGPVFAALLHQRGRFLLHASAVSVAGRTVALLGEAGAGKSTLAAALVRRGHGLLADDVAALAPSADRGFAVLPAYPQIKLWPEAAVALGLAPRRLPRARPGLEKRLWRVGARFVARAQALARAYVLEPGGAPPIRPLSPADALLALIRHSYGLRTLQGARRAAHFAECAAVARQVPIRRLTTAGDFSSLAGLVRAVEDDLACG